MKILVICEESNPWLDVFDCLNENDYEVNLIGYKDALSEVGKMKPNLVFCFAEDGDTLGEPWLTQQNVFEEIKNSFSESRDNNQKLILVGSTIDISEEEPQSYLNVPFLEQDLLEMVGAFIK